MHMSANAGTIRPVQKKYDIDSFEACSTTSGENTPLSDECPYESHTLVLTRSPGFGFGFALSGGIDEPPIEHGGDRSVYVSDVLKSGPADGVLRLFDRIVSVNGISLSGVDNATAVGVLRDAGAVATLVIKRRQSYIPENGTTLAHYPAIKSISLNRKSKNQDFGLILGLRLYVKGIIPNSPAALAKSPSRIQEGDIILRLNEVSTDDLTLNEARKLLEKSKERIELALLPILPNSVPSNEFGNGDVLAGENGNCSHEGVNIDNNSVNSWSMSSLNTKVNGHGIHNGNGSTYSGNTLTGYRVSGVIQSNGFHENHGSDSGVGPFMSTSSDPKLSLGAENARMVSFCKDGSVGIRLVGGNRSGIYIADVQAGSVAAGAGLRSGDHILQVNNFDYRQLTREEAVMHLLQAGKMINMLVEHLPANMKSLLGEGNVESSSGGDSFYVRANFDFPAGAANEPGQLMFRHGDILHVTDTLYNGTIGCWFASRLSQTNMEVDRGIIPNLTRGEQMRLVQKRQISTPSETNSGNHLGAFGTLDRASAKLFGRNKPRRAKSLSRDYWENQGNAEPAGNTDKRPAYERVRLVEPGSDFRRPVVVYGPVGDLARHRLTTEFPAVFECPVGESQIGANGTSAPNKVIRLKAIRQVMERCRHAVLDITPNSVDKLIDAGFHPIVIFIKCSTDQRQFIKDAQQRLGWHATKSSKKLLTESARLEASYSHLFSAAVNLTASDQWFVRLRQAIELSQNTAIWVPDTQAADNRLTESNVSIPNINGNAFVMPSCNTSLGGDGEDDDNEDSEMTGMRGGWKQAHPFATIRHMRNNNGNQRPLTNTQPKSMAFGRGSTVSSSAIMANIDTPGSYATLPSRRALPPPPHPPAAPPANGTPEGPISQPSTPFTKHQNLPNPSHSRTPSEYANFATLRSPPTTAAIAVPPVIPVAQQQQQTFENGEAINSQYEISMTTSTATVIEHGISTRPNSKPSHQEQHYRALSTVLTSQAALSNSTNGHSQQQPSPPNETSPQENRVYPSFYADDQLSNDQRHTINSYGTLSRPRQSKPSRSSLLAQTDFRSPIIEAKEFDNQASSGNQMPEEFERPVPAIQQQSTNSHGGNYAPLNIANQRSNTNASPYAEQKMANDAMVHGSPMSDRYGQYQTPPSPASANRYASLHLMPRPYRKVSNVGEHLSGEHHVIDGPGSPSTALTPEKPESTRSAASQAAAAAVRQQQRNQWQNIEQRSNSQSVQQPTPPTSQVVTNTDPLVLDTIRASVDYAGGVLESKATGVSLTIPRGALPPVVRQEVYFRVCSEPGAIASLQANGCAGQEHGITPVVMCGPPGLVFRRQVELRLPRAVRLRLATSPGQPPICYGPVDVDQIMSVFIDHF